jgi:hypothetical protein
MQPEEDRRPETSQPVATGPAGQGLLAPEPRPTSGQVMWGMWRLVFVIIAAFLGAMAVEAARSIF